jgi:hypothetical protein
MNTYITKPVLFVLGAICLGLAAADFFRERHGHFDIESMPLIWCVFGFAVYVVVIFMAKALRRVILRPEDYYGDEATDREDESAAGTERQAGGPSDV